MVLLFLLPLPFVTTLSVFLLLAQIPYLGFCACEEIGETGLWQLVDPPILPLTHGPNHSFSWREMLMHDWRTCCLALRTAEYLLLAHTAINYQKKKQTKTSGFRQRHHAKSCVFVKAAWVLQCGDHGKKNKMSCSLLHFPQSSASEAENVEVLAHE